MRPMSDAAPKDGPRGAASDPAHVERAGEERAIAQTAGGDRAAFRQLVERHHRGVFRLAYRVLGTAADAEDATQETFVRAYRAIDRFDPRWRFSTWLYRIALNYCRDRLRRSAPGARPEPPDVAAVGGDGGDATPEVAAVRAERARWLRGALDRLAPKYRIALVLKDVEEMPYGEMRQLLRLPITTLKIRVIRARRMLRKLLEEMEQ